MRKFTNSLTVRILSVLFVTVIPVILSLFIVNYYAVEKVRNEIFLANNDILSVYMEQVDYQLESASGFVRVVDIQQRYVSDFQSQDSTSYYYAANQYLSIISQSVSNYPLIHGITIFNMVNNAHIYSYNEHAGYTITERENVLECMLAYYPLNPDKLNKWCYVDINGNPYLIYASKVQETYFATWTSVDSLLKPMADWKTAQNAALMILQKNETWENAVGDSIHFIGAAPEDFVDFWVLEEASRIGDFKLVQLINAQTVTKTFTNIRYIAALLLLFFVLCIPIVVISLNSNVFTPIKKLHRGIEKVEKGNFDSKVDAENIKNHEFQVLAKSFNDMTGQIHSYKIKAYEDALERNRLEMQFLQVQVEPHFYLNALNTINAMAQMEDTKLIEQLTRNLSEYMRYLAGSRMKPVAIKDELNHIHNYIAILKARLGDQFVLQVSVEEGLEAVAIPPLLVQTLVENSMKYAFDVYNKTVVCVLIESKIKEGWPGVLISVSDTGTGYPDSVLQAFENNEQSLAQNQIGLMNAKRRLEYMFGNKAEFRVTNNDSGGALTIIWFPLGEEER